MSAHAATHHVDLKEENQRFYAFFNLAMFMAAVTGIELVIIFIPFPEWFVTFGIVFLSAIKFIGVILWFMHLIYDHNLLTYAFVAALVLAIGTVTALLLLHGVDATAMAGADLPAP